MAIIYGNEQASGKTYSQVFQATHGGDGNRLPYMERSFISFTFDGVPIEDFHLIATTSNNSLNRQGYAEFADVTSTYDNLPGQQYWNTHYKTNKIEFSLATDGMDQKELDNFLYLFQAGNTKELILAEHPNRAILARVSQPPQLNLLPFEQPITVKISSYSYDTSTTVYKGEIILTLVMDEPHWYSIKNILGKEKNGVYQDIWDDVSTGQEVYLFESKDALKILYEDGIPLGSMIQENMLLGNGVYAQVESQDISKIWNPTTEVGAKIEANDAVAPYTKGIIAGAIVDVNGGQITTLPRLTDAYFYYAGTAPAPTIITFTLTPDFEDNYIKTPANDYKKYHNDTTYVPYNSITIASVHTQYLRFTTPNIYTSYNKVINLFKTYIKDGTDKTLVDLREALIEEVRHTKVREWASHILDLHTNDTFTTTLSATLQNEMSDFLKNSNGEVQSATFIFNSETGEAKGQFKYRTLSSTPNVISIPVEEDVGDMLRSNYIILRDRNRPTASGVITGWTDSATGRLNSHRIRHNCSVSLSNISIAYKNMYL